MKRGTFFSIGGAFWAAIALWLHRVGFLLHRYDHPPTHIAVASLNQTVGDWSGDRDRIARLVVLPEICIK